MIKPRLVLPVLAAAAALALLAGCGGGGGSSSTDPASVAPAETPVFIEATLQPTGELKTNVEAIASRVAGVDDLGGTIVSDTRTVGARLGRTVRLRKGSRAVAGRNGRAVFLTEYDGDDFERGGFAIEVDRHRRSPGLHRQAGRKAEDPRPRTSPTKASTTSSTPTDGQAVGVVGELPRLRRRRSGLQGGRRRLPGRIARRRPTPISDIAPSAPEGSLADVYVDIGGLIEGRRVRSRPEAMKLLRSERHRRRRTRRPCSASCPGSDNVEIDVAGRLGGAQDSVPTEGAAALLGSMPANAVAAIGVGDLGKRLGEAIDTLDEQGHPGQVPPHQLKEHDEESRDRPRKDRRLLGDAAVFAEGRTQRDARRRPRDDAKNATEARNTVSNVGTPAARQRDPRRDRRERQGAGFSVRSPDLGAKPLVVAAEGERIAIGYGLPATLAGLDSESGPTLAEDQGLQRSAQLARRHADHRLRRRRPRRCAWPKACSPPPTKRKNWKN